MQHLRAARLAKRLKREAVEVKEEDDSEYIPKELVTWMDVCEEQLEEQPEKDSNLDSDSEDSEDEEDEEITDSEEQDLVQANIPAFETLIASSQRHGAFNKTFTY